MSNSPDLWTIISIIALLLAAVVVVGSIAVARLEYLDRLDKARGSRWARDYKHRNERKVDHDR